MTPDRSSLPYSHYSRPYRDTVILTAILTHTHTYCNTHCHSHTHTYCNTHTYTYTHTQTHTHSCKTFKFFCVNVSISCSYTVILRHADTYISALSIHKYTHTLI